MSNRTCTQSIVVAVLLLAAIVLYANFVLFPTVEIAKNTQTVNHTYEPTPKSNQCPVQKKPGGHGGGGIIIIGA